MGRPPELIPETVRLTRSTIAAMERIARERRIPRATLTRQVIEDYAAANDRTKDEGA